MSAQNVLKKPVFTKSVMGYTPKEVDQYIEYMNERYAAVNRDVAELRRRLTRLQLGLDTIEKEPAAEAPGFTDAALDKLRHMISAERSRHGEALDALLDFIETYKDGREVREKVVMDMSDEGFVPLDDETDEASEVINEPEVTVISEEDAEWEEALESFIADTSEDEPDKDSSSDEKDEDTDEFDYAVAADIFGAEAAEDVVEDVKAEPADTVEAVDDKSAAQRALELDFYSDDVVRDGESYDPMTLARSATMQKRPSLEDFMKPLENGQKPKKR